MPPYALKSFLMPETPENMAGLKNLLSQAFINHFSFLQIAGLQGPPQVIKKIACQADSQENEYQSQDFFGLYVYQDTDGRRNTD
jgi:hypothetical protein